MKYEDIRGSIGDGKDGKIKFLEDTDHFSNFLIMDGYDDLAVEEIVGELRRFEPERIFCVPGEKLYDSDVRVLSSSKEDYRRFPDRAEALRYLVDNAGRDDVVLILGERGETRRAGAVSDEEIIEAYLRTK